MEKITKTICISTNARAIRKEIIMKKLEKSVFISLVICLFATLFFDTANTADTIRKSTLRLHVIADDNSPQAQNIKIKVKDDLQNILPEIYRNADSRQRALQATNDNMEFIQQVADNTLKQNGRNYTAAVTIEDFYFDTNRYNNFTMPRGNYTALTVRLGRRQGKNWWCVAYPGLCVSSRAKYEDEKSNTFIETDTLRIKFKAVELWEELKQVFKKDNIYNNC